MKRFLNILAQSVSIACYPLWIPTYGILLFCCAVQQILPLPPRYWLVSLGTTLFLTGLLPLSLIGYQVHQGYIQDIYIDRREDRTLAYIETAFGFGFWWYLLAFVLKVPSWLSGIAVGATVSILLVALINRWWKISAHLTGMGGLLGGVLTYALAYGTFPSALIYTLLGITLLVMYARLYLNAHTPWQVIAGLALGMLCTILIPFFFYG